MTMQYIRDCYKVPVRRGSKVVNQDGYRGTITSAPDHYVRVRLDGRRHSLRYHPMDLTYLKEQP